MATISVYVLLLDDSIDSTVLLPVDIFRLSSWFWKKTQPSENIPQFEVEFIAGGNFETGTNPNLSYQVNQRYDEITTADIIIVPAIKDVAPASLSKYTEMFSWLKNRHDNGCLITAMGTGVFVLAQAGLLNGKAATTHWYYVDEFRKQHSDVDLQPDRLITDTDNIICSGGNCGYDLPLYIIEKYCGHEFAVLASKFLVLDLGRKSQTPYTLFDFQLKHKDEKILTAQAWINENFSKNLSMDALAENLNMTVRTFQRRFKKATGVSPFEYLQKYRVEIAKRKFETSDKSLENISYEVGYQSASSFGKIFKKHVGLSPASYRKLFSLDYSTGTAAE